MSEHLSKEFAHLELNLAIQQLKKNSAPGEDQFTYEFFQRIPETGRFVILRLFNAVWRRGRLPKAWKHAIVIPILKSGRKGPASYIVIPTDIANVNTQQTDGETGDKPANVVSGEVQPAVEHTVGFSKRQKHC